MRTAWNYIQRVILRYGMAPRLLLLVTLALGGALLDGVGLGFLIPIVESLQDRGDGPMNATGLSGLFASAFRFLGLPYTLPVILAVGLLLFLSQLLFTYFRVLLSSRMYTQFTVDLRTKIFAHLLDFDLAFFHRSRIGDLTNTVITETYRAGYSLRAMAEMFAALCVLVVYALVEFLISWKMALIAFPVLGTVAVLLRPRRSYELGVTYSDANNDLQSTAVESLGGIREIMSLGIGGLMARRFRQTTEALARVDVVLQEKGARFTLVYQGAVITIIVGLVYMAAQSAEMSLASILVFLVVLQRMAPRVGIFAEERHWWLGSVNAMEKVEALLESTARARACVKSGTVPVGRLERSIAIRDLRFRHAGHTMDTLAGVSFVIPCGRMVAIVGPSGAGKSTLLDLLARFYDPTAGAIYIDSHDLRGLDLSSWRRSIGLVSQDAFLFNDTVENNIRFGDLSATTEQVAYAAQRAYADRFIVGLPDGYATVVGDRGVKLSGGQRQRIALARAILRQPQLLLLDEATSDLDSESEMYIQQAIREIGTACTVVMVAHRLSTVEESDLIVVLENGVVLEEGTHLELLARNGRYAEFSKLQSKHFVAPSDGI
jgi:subfamily B ATP-binding cassette protein MsbA